MFCAVNTEAEAQKKLVEKEADTIRKMYFAALKSLDIDPVMSFVPVHDQNQSICKQAKANLLYGYSKRNSIEQLNQNLEKYGMLAYKHVLFVIAEKNINSGRFLRAKKLLNLAHSKGWKCNTLYALYRRINDEYFNTPRKHKKHSFTKPSLDLPRSKLLRMSERAAFDRTR